MPKPPAPPKPKFNWRLALRLLTWTAVIAGFAWAGKEVRWFLMTDPRFELVCDATEPACASLEIRGLIYASRARIQALFAQDFGESVFHIPLAERRRRMLAVDWVKTASIARIWPNRIIVSITERRPVAFAKLPAAGAGRYRLGLIDEAGVLLSLPPRVRWKLPVLSGLSEDQTDSERRVRVRAMQRLLDDLGPEAKSISEINAGSIEDLRVVADINGQPVELWLGDRNFQSRFLNFTSHYQEMRRRFERASVFDLRFEDRILAR